ncbi:MAG: MazG nucleotide pyrophosphohydrolase domain-containing protein [Candidatus Thorarchaeota archaeon]
MTEKKSLKEIQQDINDWILKHGDYWPPLSMLCAIMEEFGELAREINYLEGFKPKKSREKFKTDLGEELADIMFSVICLANYYKIDLNEKINNVIKKYSKRDANRFI